MASRAITETDTVTVTGIDENGNTATDEDDAVVTIVPAPDIAIVKSVDAGEPA